MPRRERIVRSVEYDVRGSREGGSMGKAIVDLLAERIPGFWRLPIARRKALVLRVLFIVDGHDGASREDAAALVAREVA